MIESGSSRDAILLIQDGVITVTAQDYTVTNRMIRQLSTALRELADGNLSCPVEQKFEPEY